MELTRHQKYRQDNLESLQQKAREYYLKNKKTISEKAKEYRRNKKEELRAYGVSYRAKNIDSITIKKKEYYEKNKADDLRRGRKYRANNIDRVRKYHREYIAERRNTDCSFKMVVSLRARLWSSLKITTTRKNNKTLDYIGCSKEHLKSHLEAQFKEGMSWENYGEWHIDHIHPLSKFSLSEEAEIYKAMHYSNLQPLWAQENRSKGSKIII